MGSDRSRFGRLLEKLENDFTAGHDNYPKTLTNAYNMLLEWKDDPRLLMRMAGNDGISFTTTTTETNEEQTIETEDTHSKEAETTHTNTTLGQGGRGRGRGGRMGGRGGRGNSRDNIQCFCCGAMGHYASQCPETLKDAQGMLDKNTETGTNMLHHTTMDEQTTPTTEEMIFASLIIADTEDNNTSFVFAQDVRNVETQNGGQLPLEWILLDNQSPVDVFTNRHLLKNIRRAEKHMFIHCTAGVAKTNLVGDLPRYGTVWYHPDGIANILSLSKVKEKYRVTFDSGINNQFIVHRADGTQRVFQQSSRGLYFLDTSLTP